MASETATPSLLFLGFNQDDGCFACGTENGFIIYNCEFPVKERFRRDLNGGIGIVEMLFRCNILALVGGGKNPCYPPNKVMIWDDYQNKCIAELEFSTTVRAVRLRKDRIVVAVETKVFVYNFTDLQLIHTIETTSNPNGILALSPKENCVLVCPGTEPGHVHVELYESDGKRSHNTFEAHENNLACLALNLDGSLLATASEKGTLIRVFNTSNGQKLREVRRGSTIAEIYSIKFRSDSKVLVVTSDKGTIHWYSLEQENSPEAAPANQKSNFSMLGSFLPSYFSSEWSFCQFQLPNEYIRTICGFLPQQSSNAVIAICMDGSYHKILYDPRKGETTADGIKNLFRSD